MTKDPVCGMVGKEELKYEYKGHIFYFCSNFCRNEFQKSPENYTGQRYITTAVEGKKERKIAYFSMEIGINSHIPTYSGGLGVLAGDTIRSCADLKVPMVAVTLLYEKGYFYQKLDILGNQQEIPVQWNPEDFLKPLPNKVSVQIEKRTVVIQAWQFNILGITGYSVPIVFLDTDLKENNEYDRGLNDYLYGGDQRYRFAQEIILGVGGVRMLHNLGYTEIRKYHLNEGHASLLTLELLQEQKIKNEFLWDYETVRNLCVFTTHTPVPAGHDQFSYDLVNRVLGELVPLDILKMLAGEEKLNTTLLALNLSKYINGVAKKHGDVSKSMFPGYPIDSITNGVHSVTWTCDSFKELYDKYIPGWKNDPFSLRYALNIPKREIWQAHDKAKRILVDYINKEENAGFHYDTFTIGFARRATLYKRADLVFSDINRLIDISDTMGKIQIVFAGKAHPQDWPGKEMIKRIFSDINRLRDKVKIIYLENYDMELGKMLTSGVDLWLNTPQRPNEASGTSGMKATHNGVPSFSVLDGWWIEGHIEGVTGWSIGPETIDSGYDSKKDAEELYRKLETIIVPIFYHNRNKWIGIMQHSIAINASFFNTHRMVQQYVLNSYFI
ncbi:glycogen phosphorylase [Candidatus Jettenia caeni]|uniref:Glycogen phosphorylase n=2 Tax=Candidatus Jettenia TaxID=360731 RepID=I3INE6_9BACT|nr:glycogen phosphorylase [Candidatus Jettenia caeni]